MSICVGCGLCCDGSLFGAVGIEAGEQPEGRLRAVPWKEDAFGNFKVAAPTFATSGLKMFPLPCVAFGNGCCTIYEARPSSCRQYRCGLLRRHNAGEVSEGEARTLIAKTVELKDRVRSGLVAFTGDNTPLPLLQLCWLAVHKFEASPDPEADRFAQRETSREVNELLVILADEFTLRMAWDGEVAS